MMFGGIEVARVLGIRLRLDWSWFVVLVLLTWMFATVDFPFRAPDIDSGMSWILGFIAALLLFASVLIHELAHAVVARARGIPVERITLFIFGGVAEMRMEARRPVDEFLLTIVGPVASLALAGLFWGLEVGAVSTGGESAALVAGTLAQLNLILAVFNMVPAFPLDGGRILRSALWKMTGDLTRATRWAAGVGRMFGWLLIAWGVWIFVVYDARLGGAWAVFLGWFLAGAAAATARRSHVQDLRSSLAVHPVSEVLGRPEPPVQAGASVAALIRDSLLPRPGGARLVVRNGAVIGAVSLEDAAAVPMARRTEVPVFEIMTPLSDLTRLSAGLPVADAAASLTSDEGRPAIIEAGSQPLGAVTMSDLRTWIHRLEKLDG